MTRYFSRGLIAMFFGVLSLVTITEAQAKTLKWAGCGISKNAFMNEMVAAYEKKTGVKIELVGGGATKGIRQVAAHEMDVGGTCRQTLEDPQTLMPDANERRVQLTPVAWDALVVITHKDNPVENLTLEQVRRIYTGQITNWKEVGGRDAPIELYVRKGKISGVGRTIRELIFNNYEQEFVARHVVEESATLEKDMVSDPNGMGITGVSSARKLREAKILKLEGKEASYDNIKNGEYLLYRPLYLVSNIEKTDPDVRKFINFVLSSEGRAIMRNVGTVPYEDGIVLWLKYLDQQNRALGARFRQRR